MVVHLSSKLSHLAQSFRPQHHFNTLRNAFPSASSSGHSPGFFDPANVFQQTNHHAVAPASAQAAGAGPSQTAGGAGGAKWSAGSRAPNWGFQSRLVSQAPATADHPSRLNDDESDGDAIHIRRPSLFTSASNRSRLSLRQRSGSLVSSDRPELLTTEEAGLPSARLSSAEMQRRYRSAFSQGQMTQEVKEMELEADEMDFGPPSNVVSSGRRASISSPPSPTLGAQTLPSKTPARTTTTTTTPSSTRSIHSSSRFARSSPPRADLPRVRRNSTSSAPSTSEPLADIDPLDFPRKTHRRRDVRPPNSAPTDRTPPQWRSAPTTSSAEANSRHQAILTAQKAHNYGAVEAAVLRYTAVRDSYSVSTHNAAMEALRTTRLPNTPIRRIVELYTELFNHDQLRPDRNSYEIIIRTLAQRDIEVLRNIKFLQRRVKKKQLAMAARGGWYVPLPGDSFLLDGEQKELARLEQEDYLSPAVEIYKALGDLGDRLHHSAVALLISAAAQRKRVDLALSLFSRLEKSPTQDVSSSVYEVLIKMYGEDKDVASVLEVFEAYLDARARGLKVGSITRSNAYRTTAVKHAHTASPEYEHVGDSDYFSGGDEALWRTTIMALFAAGDSAQAITVFQRMLDSMPGGEKAQDLPGYPKVLRPDVISNIVSGFIRSGDLDSAKTWFDRGLQPTPENPAPSHIAYYTNPFYAAIDDQSNHALVNHVYRTMLARAGPNFLLVISDFVAVIDHNLAAVYAASTPEQTTAAIEAILEFRAGFEKAAESGFVDDRGESYSHSSGVTQRIAMALGHAGRYKEAAETYVQLTKIIRRAYTFAERNQNENLRRDSQKWVLIGSGDSVAGALGMQRQGKAKEATWVYPSNARPPVKYVAQVVSALNQLRQLKGWDLVPVFETTVVESYLLSKAQVDGKVASLELSGAQWYTIIEAFASVQSQLSRGYVPAFDFPGFEPIIDDFAASGANIPSAGTNYTLLVQSLKAGGMSRDRTLAVLAVLDQNLAESIEQENAAILAAAQPPPVQEPVVSPEELAATAVSEEEVTSDSSALDTSATSFPTPPSTPPTYFAELPAAPTAPSTQHTLSIDKSISHRIDSLLFNVKTDAAVKAVREAVAHGQSAHPEALGRLIEALGREGKVDAVREVYLTAYATLAALDSDPSAQSVAWVQLEDHMIIALAQAGLLNDVAYHRDRLLEAGSAPSADGYAAMILNMKETTDDAAVALMLFEESQRFGVVPNVYLFNTLISKLSRARRAKEALEYFELMKRHNLPPSSITYGAIINACCKTGDDVSAAYLFQEMVASPKFKPRVPPYNTMIQFYTQTKPDRESALHYYQQLVDAKVAPTGHTYKLLLDAYGAIGTPDLKAMQHVFHTLVNDRTVTVTGAHWASLINAYGVVAHDLEAAIKVFESIEGHAATKKSKVQLPDAVVYESLLNALLANDRADLCDKYLAEMEKKGVRMTAYVANTLIKGHAAQKNLDAARAVFESLADPPSGVAAAGNHPVDRHPKHQHQPTPTPVANAGAPVYREPSTWDTMIRCELAAGENEKAVQLMRRVEERAFPEAVVNRIRKTLSDVGLETISIPNPSPSTPPPS